MPKKIDLTGQKFGRLTVTGEAPPKYTSGGNRKVMWYADCDCGNKYKTYSSGDLRNGHVKSCGCLNREVASKRMKEQQKRSNTYDLTSRDYGIGYMQSGEEFWFDKEDYDLIKDYCWYKHRQYIEAKIPGTDKHIGLHKLIMHDEDNLYDIDHIDTDNHNDNRKCNLRIVTRSQNNTNKVRQRNNTSGINGVYYNNSHRCWRATININKKHYQYDCKTFDEAVKLRKELEDKYYGEYSYGNSQKIANKNKKENA